MCTIWGLGQGSFFSTQTSSCSLHNLLKRWSFHHSAFFAPLSKIKWTCTCRSTSGCCKHSIDLFVYSHPNPKPSVLLNQQHKLWNQVVWGFHIPSSVFIVFLAILGHLHFHMNCQIILWVSTENAAEILIEMVLNLQTNLRRMNFTVIFSLLMHRHGKITIKKIKKQVTNW